MRACRERGLLVVRLVHGRGKGVQRAVVRRVLARLPEVDGFDDAPPRVRRLGRDARPAASLAKIKSARSLKIALLAAVSAPGSDLRFRPRGMRANIILTREDAAP